MIFPRRVAWLMWTIPVLGLAALAAAAAEPRWTEVSSAGAIVYTDGEVAPAQKLARELTLFRGIATDFVLGDGAHPAEPTLVVLFAGKRGWSEVKPGGNKEVDGLAATLGNHSVVLLTTQTTERTRRRVLFHEGVHWMLAQQGCRPPLWLHEGLAEVFSTFAIAKGTYRGGDAVPEHVALLRKEKLWPLERLFAVREESPEYREGEPAGIFYAQSWALTHLLLFGQKQAILRDDPAVRDALVRGEAGAVEQLVLARLGGKPAAEAALAAYIRSGRYQFLTGTYEVTGKVDGGVRPAPAGAVAYALGVALAGDGRWAPAAERLREAARARPGDPRPLEGLAWCAHAEQRCEDAWALLARAQELGGGDDRLLAEVALGLLQEAGRVNLTAGSEPRAPLWIPAIRRRLAREPGRADLVQALAELLCRAPECHARDADEVAALAPRLGPQPMLEYLLAWLDDRVQRPEACDNRLRKLAADEAVPAALREQSRGALQQREAARALDRAQELVRTGDADGALAALARLNRAGLPANVARAVDELTSAAKFRSGLNRALQHLQARDFVAARSALHDLETVATRPDQQAMLERLSGQCDADERAQHYADRLSAALEAIKAGRTVEGAAALRDLREDPAAPPDIQGEAERLLRKLERPPAG